MDLDNFMTVEQAAFSAKCHPNTIRNMDRRGELPNTYRNGRVVLISKSDLSLLMNKKAAGHAVSFLNLAIAAAMLAVGLLAIQLAMPALGSF